MKTTPTDIPDEDIPALLDNKGLRLETKSLVKLILARQNKTIPSQDDTRLFQPCLEKS